MYENIIVLVQQTCNSSINDIDEFLNACIEVEHNNSDRPKYCDKRVQPFEDIYRGHK